MDNISIKSKLIIWKIIPLRDLSMCGIFLYLLLKMWLYMRISKVLLGNNHECKIKGIEDVKIKNA